MFWSTWACRQKMNSFITESTGPVLEAYNVCGGDRYRRIKLVDGLDFNLTESIMTDRLHYIRHLPYEYNSVCLPVNVNSGRPQRTPDDALPQEPWNQTLLSLKKSVVEAGIPFILKDSTKYGYLFIRETICSLIRVHRKKMVSSSARS